MWRIAMSWTDERVTLLKKLWGEGKTAAEIASTLGGVTRNAVIGKAHRLKLSNRVSPIQQNNKSPAPKPVPQKKAVLEQTPPKTRKRLNLMDLSARMCRWPGGDPRDSDFGFCGEECVPGLPYCASHAKTAYQAAGRVKALQAEDFVEKGARSESDDQDEAIKAA